MNYSLFALVVPLTSSKRHPHDTSGEGHKQSIAGFIKQHSHDSSIFHTINTAPDTERTNWHHENHVQYTGMFCVSVGISRELFPGPINESFIFLVFVQGGNHYVIDDMGNDSETQERKNMGVGVDHRPNPSFSMFMAHPCWPQLPNHLQKSTIGKDLLAPAWPQFQSPSSRGQIQPVDRLRRARWGWDQLPDPA